MNNSWLLKHLCLVYGMGCLGIAIILILAYGRLSLTPLSGLFIVAGVFCIGCDYVLMRLRR